MSYSSFRLNHLRLWNNRGQHVSWIWWPLTILSTTLLEPLFSLIQKRGRVPNCTINDNLCHWRGTLQQNRVLPYKLLFPRDWWTARSKNRWLSTILMTFKSSVKVKVPCWRWTSRISQGLLLNIKLEDPSWFDTYNWGQELLQTWWRWLMSLCQIPFDATISQVSLQGTVSLWF